MASPAGPGIEELHEIARQRRKRRERILWAAFLGGFAVLFGAIWAGISWNTDGERAPRSAGEPGPLEPGSGGREEEIGVLWTDKPVLGMVLAGENAYLATDDLGLTIVNVAEPGAPVKVGQLDTSGKASDVAVAGATAYVAAGTGGLRIVDVSHPDRPVERGSVPTPGQAMAVDVSPGTACVADGEGLRVIDVTAPDEPRVRAALQGAVVDVAVTQRSAYLADKERGLLVVDLQRLDAPRVIARVKSAKQGLSVAVDGSRVYFGAQDLLQILDVSDPAEPRKMGQYTVSRLEVTSTNARGTRRVGRVEQVLPAGDRLLIARGAAGAHVVDISTPSEVKGKWWEKDSRGYVSTVAYHRRRDAILIGTSFGLVISDLQK